MRVLQLLAIAAVCPLAGIGGGCQKIEQPIGEYQAASSRDGRRAGDTSSTIGQTNPTSSDAPDATFDAGSDAAISSDPSIALPHAGTAADEMMPPPSRAGEAPGSAPVASMSVCKPVRSLVAERKSVDMYIAMDANITLPYTGLWETITAGLRQFVADGASVGTGVGLRYFGSQCDPDPYNEQPTVEVGELPGNEAALVAATNTRTTYTSSMMAPALQGSIYHQTARAIANPDVKQVVVMMSDGFTSDLSCRYSTQDLEDIADTGFNATHSIETYVIGFGFPDTMSTIADEVLARFSPLDSIAAKGGTRKATILKSTDDAAAVSAALQAARRTAQPCEYKVPDGVDASKLNLAFVPFGQIPRVDDSAKCGQKPGFWYDPADGMPTTMKLCPTSCQTLQQNDYAAAIVIGCPTLRR
jgi:hypothetical protein